MPYSLFLLHICKLCLYAVHYVSVTCCTTRDLTHCFDSMSYTQTDCKQTHAECDCCDSFCVLCRLSAMSQFFRIKSICFFSKKQKKTGKKKEGRTEGCLCQSVPNNYN